MLEKTSSHHIISQASLAPLIAKVRAELDSKHHALRVDELPTLHSIFPFLAEGGIDDDVKPYPASSKPFDMNDVALYIHSSGSTGHPKPIPQRHTAVLDWCCSGEDHQLFVLKQC